MGYDCQAADNILVHGLTFSGRLFLKPAGTKGTPH
jgi:hypothetical protein